MKRFEEIKTFWGILALISFIGMIIFYLNSELILLMAISVIFGYFFGIFICS